MHPSRRIVVLLLVALFAAPSPARAWDEIGHQIVAYLAWQHMTPEARAEAVALLRAGPWRSGLPGLLPPAGPPANRERTFFLRASTWADLVRDDAFPERRAAYHRGSWHYVNFFWEEGPDGPRERTEFSPAPVNALERLERLSTLVDEDLPRAQRAIYLAWILHLVGDLHQPLHTSARITEREPEGDRGGNLFRLAGGTTLHGYWDGILSRTHERRPGESEGAFVARVAEEIAAAHPPAEVLSPGPSKSFEGWAREGYEHARRDVYLPAVHRGEVPPDAYRRHAYDVAAPAVARAGYRLADLLNRVLD